VSQEDYIISDQTGVSFLSDLNDTLAAIVSNNSGATAPPTTYPYMWWADTAAGILRQRNAANSAWINKGTLATANSGFALLTSADFTGQLTSTAGDLNLKTNTALSDAAATLTAAQLIGGEFTITPTEARILTADTATNIISALSGSVDNSNFEFTVINLAAFDVTIALGTGVTLVGNMAVNGGSATFRARRLTSSTVSITRLETGVAGTVFASQSTVDAGTNNTEAVSPDTLSGAVTTCKSWVNFNGTGVVAIRSSFNVSSITDNGTGIYTVNFATAMADAVYSTNGSANFGSSIAWVSSPRDGGVKSTASLQITVVSAGANADLSEVSVQVFGN